ncbi:MAG: hypothetical protein WBD40_17965 [Tepidisphaeraceae bacterium]
MAVTNSNSPIRFILASRATDSVNPRFTPASNSRPLPVVTRARFIIRKNIVASCCITLHPALPAVPHRTVGPAIANATPPPIVRVYRDKRARRSARRAKSPEKQRKKFFGDPILP